MAIRDSKGQESDIRESKNNSASREEVVVRPVEHRKSESTDNNGGIYNNAKTAGGTKTGTLDETKVVVNGFAELWPILFAATGSSQDFRPQKKTAINCLNDDIQY